jgi:elongation factor Ts
MSVSAAQVKALREATGAGMMDCKKALTETNGDFEEAKTYLKKKGIADSAKRAGRTASEGKVVIAEAADGRACVVVEINCETDFVARNDEFGAFAEEVAAKALSTGAGSVDELLAADWDGQSVELRMQVVSGKIGEKIDVSNVGWGRIPDGKVGGFGTYLHDGGRIGVVVTLTAASEADAAAESFQQLGRDLAMHVAASSPVVVNSDELDETMVAKEKEIFLAQAENSGKPADIREKMVLGRLAKWKKEISLLDQPFVKNPDLTVAKHVAEISKSLSGKADVVSFVRFRVGERPE